MEPKNRTIRQAFFKSIPVLAGYVVLGIGFGILMRDAEYIWCLCRVCFDNVFIDIIISINVNGNCSEREGKIICIYFAWILYMRIFCMVSIYAIILHS